MASTLSLRCDKISQIKIPFCVLEFFNIQMKLPRPGPGEKKKYYKDSLQGLAFVDVLPFGVSCSFRLLFPKSF